MYRFSLNIRILLVVAISALVLIATLSISLLHTVKFRDYAEQEALKRLRSAAESIKLETERLLEPALAISRHTSARNTGKNGKNNIVTDRYNEFSAFLDTIEIVPSQSQHISSAYMGFEDGSFVILTENTPELLHAVPLPANYDSSYLRFERNALLEKPVDQWSRKVDGRWITESFPSNEYDPRSRPWYKLAKRSKKQVWTGLYQFHVANGYGVTLVRDLRETESELNAVLGIDLRLEYLTEFVRSLDISPNGFAFVARSNGDLIAHPDLIADALGDDVDSNGIRISDLTKTKFRDSNLFTALSNSDEDIVRVNIKEETVLGHRIPLDREIGLDAYLYVGAPLSDFTTSANEAARSGLLIAGLVVCFMLGFGIWIAQAIARPVRKAAATMSAVSQLDTFNEPKPARSTLSEIDLLNGAAYRMSSALKGFVRYLPQDLVRDLLDLEHPIALGGAHREITVLFTDIEQFTKISETEDPDDLVQGLADYFDIISEVISESGGTIDKFIGDSVMAFWGAPRKCPDHSQKACNSVLEISRRLQSYNEDRAVSGLPEFKTRFGLHTGRAFVGNVGARERFGYTALGDIVNTAARLEQMNKELNTNILISGQVAAALKQRQNLDFKGQVQLRGKKSATNVYEMSSIQA